MTAPLRLSRPLQRRCAQCRRVQDVRITALYHVVVPNKGGGTRRDGGYDCRFCGHENVIPATEMPQGILIALPDHAEQRRAAEAAKAPDDPEPAVTPTPGPKKKPPAPVVSKAKAAPPPTWIVGTAARKLLVDAHDRSERDPRGLCSAYLRAEDGALEVVDIRGRIDGDILGWLDGAACELLVLAGGHADGSRWKAVFHPLAGAATLAVEPG